LTFLNQPPVVAFDYFSGLRQMWARACGSERGPLTNSCAVAKAVGIS
jgi:hypothetical protein